MNKVIYTKKAPAPVGPYSQAILANNTLYCSGQIAINPETDIFERGTVTEQTERICKNISALLEEAGTSFENVIKTTCFLTSMEDFAEFNRVYEKYFISKPARSCVAAKELPKDALAEIEVIAQVLQVK